MKQIVALLLTFALFGQAATAWAQSPRRDGVAAAGLAAGSVVGTVVYTPFKALLCAMGLGTTPLLFLESGRKAASTVGDAACNGTWVITPDVLKGRKPLDVVHEIPCCDYPER
jgi:hypothetical protein